MQLEPNEPEARAPAEFIQRYTVEQAEAQLLDWQGRRDQEDPRWSDLAGATNALLYLTPAELSQVLHAWSAIVTPLANRRPVGYASKRPPDATPISLTLVAVPIPPTEQGG